MTNMNATVHCENCGRDNPEIRDCYTDCCNELVCYGGTTSGSGRNLVEWKCESRCAKTDNSQQIEPKGRTVNNNLIHAMNTCSFFDCEAVAINADEGALCLHHENEWVLHVDERHEERDPNCTGEFSPGCGFCLEAFKGEIEAAEEKAGWPR